MTVNHRCTNRRGCGARKTLKRSINQYTRRPLCPGCGKDTLKTVAAKEKARTKRRTCYCDGYLYPHRIGSGVWCEHHPTGPIEEDYISRYQHD